MWALTRMAVCVRLDKLVLTVILVCFLLLTALYHPIKVQLPHSLVSSLNTQDMSDGRLGKTTVVSFPLHGMKKSPHFNRTKRSDCKTVRAKDFKPPTSPKVSMVIKERVLQNCSVEVQVSPCACTRTIHTTLLTNKPCPQDADSLLQRVVKEFGDSVCSDLATLRGVDQQVVSYSVFGEFPNDYYLGLHKLLPRIKEVYPEWNVRVYIDASYNSLLPWMCQLACQHPHLDFCNIAHLPNLDDVIVGDGIMWRFGVIGDTLVKRYMMRDTDSPILTREVDAVRHWLSTNTCYHIMRDNLHHNWVMMAGMWGGCNNWQGAVGVQVGQKALCVPSHDQNFLKVKVWPVARLNATIHDSYTCQRFPGSQPFPSQRSNFTFVGQRSYRGRYRWETTHTQCPVNCRPKLHQDWLYC
ncbi:hypothetical protein Pmani_031977 [Petrolisthes manimaculis]|uniref:Uncharacterized protein n=1 Tax=Petrolisthes manimaculis TaxID=1843537 RepID=A0AAE1TRV7_9EUCA|nr:hypothetical protein Pmani_031977 [Petrolisthes manimaculis]